MKASRQRDRSAVILLIAGVVLFGLCCVCILAQPDPPEPPPPLPPGPKPFWFIIEAPPEHATLSKDGVTILPDKYPFRMRSDQTPEIPVNK